MGRKPPRPVPSCPIPSPSLLASSSNMPSHGEGVKKPQPSSWWGEKTPTTQPTRPPSTRGRKRVFSPEGSGRFWSLAISISCQLEDRRSPERYAFTIYPHVYSANCRLHGGNPVGYLFSSALKNSRYPIGPLKLETPFSHSTEALSNFYRRLSNAIPVIVHYDGLQQH